MNDEDRIRRTLNEYSQLLDDGRFDEWADLFTEDARLELGDQATVGRPAIRAYMAEVQASGRRGMHVTTNSLVDVDVDGDTARATTDYLFVRPGAEGLVLVAAGRYHDRMVRDGERWRFRVRSITMLPSDPGGAGA